MITSKTKAGTIIVKKGRKIKNINENKNQSNEQFKKSFI